MNQAPVKQSGDLATHERRPEAPNVILKPKGSVDPKDDFASSSVQNPRKLIGPPTFPEIVPQVASSSVEVAAPFQRSEERKRAERLVGLFRNLAR